MTAAASGAMQGPQWCTIESDPGVFTELIGKFGVEDVQVEELWGLDDESLQRLTPMYGLIFLFKWDKDIQQLVSENALDVVPDGVFFAKQVIHNACATQAIINVLLNSSKKLKLGKVLSNFLHFSADLDPESRGMALQASQEIREAHNSFARPDPIQFEKVEDTEGDAFHFISYVPVNGYLYEMDGLQTGPRLIGECTEKNWYKVAKQVLQSKMAQYGAKELRFTLLALCQNLQTKYTQEMRALTTKRDNNNVILDDEYEYFDKEYVSHFPAEDIEARLLALAKLVDHEAVKFAQWTKENIRRRHNYFPFIFQLIQKLAESRVLQEMTNRAVAKKKIKLKNRADAEAEAEAEAAQNANSKKSDTDTNTNSNAPKTSNSSTGATKTTTTAQKSDDVTMTEKK